MSSPESPQRPQPGAQAELRNQGSHSRMLQTFRYSWKDVVKTQRWRSQQPRGMVWKPCNYWDKLPTSTGSGFLPSIVVTIWVFPKIGVGPQNGWFIRENLILRWFGGTPIFGNIHFERIHKGDTKGWWLMTFLLMGYILKWYIKRWYPPEKLIMHPIKNHFWIWWCSEVPFWWDMLVAWRVVFEPLPITA